MSDEPHNEYLWDRSGEPDTYLRGLEDQLARYRFDKPIRIAEKSIPMAARRGRWRWIAYGGAAAAAAIIVFAGYVALIPVFGQPGTEWRVVAREGEPIVSGVAIVGSGTLVAGGVVQTDAHSRAVISAGKVGRIEVQPGSSVRLISTAPGRHRLAVERGRIVAKLWAPPFTFGFATPAADVFDVGCAFTMDVDGRGAATVRVTSGWVQFETAQRRQVVPEGAVAIAEPGKSVGTAYFEDASMDFKAALRTFDFEPMTENQRRHTWTTLLTNARRQDVFTLLSLTPELTQAERGELFDRVTALQPPPVGVTRAGIQSNNGKMLDAWIGTLGLPVIKRWWVHWPDVFSF